MYTEYKGMELRTGRVRKYQFPEPKTAEEVLRILTSLNSSADTYGIVYFI